MDWPVRTVNAGTDPVCGAMLVEALFLVALLGLSGFFSTRSLEIAEQAFAGIKAALDRIFNSELPALRKSMDEAGVPWTPGRGIPGRN